MSKESEIIENRKEKLQKIIKSGILAFPAVSNRDLSCLEASDNFKSYRDKEVVLAGRIKLLRLHGGSCFMTIDDGTGKFQLFFSKKEVGSNSYKQLKLYDLGDFIESHGTLFKTRKGEKTLMVKSFKLLAKSIRPLPEKWHGLKDVNERYRFRELDLIPNLKIKKNFLTRSKIIKEIRDYLESEGFVEVETPVLQVVPGGASAKPFMTHHNAFDIDMYLRIAPELYLKRLIVGGFEKIFEIGRQFRNEGVDHQHNPEFTSCEFYWAYQDYEGLMEFTEEMLSRIVENVTGDLKIKYEGEEIDFTPPWPRHVFHEILMEKTGVNVLEVDDEKKLREIIESKGFKTDKSAGFAKLVDDFYKDAVRSKLIQPCFVIDHPIELEPLAKKKEDNPRLVQRFQLLVYGFELLKAYSELNDPIDQLERFKVQQKLREKGDEEAQFIDDDFIKSLEYGMPPTAGWGMGIDRFVALLTNSHSLREVILFPTMKPENVKNVEDVQDFASQKGKSSCDENEDPGITRDEALKFIKERVKTENSIKHMLATEAIMKGLANELKQNQEVWGLAGLLHDADMEMKEAIDDPSKQGVIVAKELEKMGVLDTITSAIRAHNEKTGEPRNTLIKQAIYAVDPLTGLIITTALVRPDKKISSVELKSLKKKFKDKSFARGVKREAIKTCQEFGLSIDRFLEIGLLAIRKIAHDLGL